MLEITNVTKLFGQGSAAVKALNNISLTVHKGDYIAVMGPSGSGKSTLLNIIGGLERISRGEVKLDGVRIDNMDENELVDIRRGKISYVFQQYHLLPSLTALENVLLPLTFWGNNTNDTIAVNMLSRVGLKSRITHKPGQLSGGEQQRVAIARAMISRPELILADEPTGNMDQKTGNEILDLFNQLNNEGHTIIMVTHDPNVASYAEEIVFLNDGEIVKRIKNKKEKDNDKKSQTFIHVK